MAFDKIQQYKAYNVASATVPKTRQVVMLYDGAIRFMQQAKLAIDEKRIEDRFNLLNKVSEVLLGLQGSLDYTHGGEIAPLLYDYYSSLDSRIIYVQRTNDMKILDSVIAELKTMRGAWGEIDEQVKAGENSLTPSYSAQAAQNPQNPAQPVAATPESKAKDSIFVSA